MSFELIPSAFAQAAEGATKSGAPMWPMLLALFAIMYFFILKPQQKKQKETKNMLNTLEKGARVVTIGGICGTVANIKEKKGNPSGEDTVIIKVGGDTKLEMTRSSIGRVLSKEDVANNQ